MPEAVPDVTVAPGTAPHGDGEVARDGPVALRGGLTGAAGPADSAAADTPTAVRWQRDYERIARAIHWLDLHRTERPQLVDLAAALHLSPSHLQRTFSRFAGTSPSRFLRWLSASAARELLRERATVLDATAGAGLSSSGRLHELLVTLDAVTPGEIGRAGDGLTIRTGVHPTPLGFAAVAVTDRGVLSLAFPEPPGASSSAGSSGAGSPDAAAAEVARRTGGAVAPDLAGAAAAVLDRADAQLAAAWPNAQLVRDPTATRPVVDHLVAALDGAQHGRPLVASVVGTNLQLKVWEALLRLPAGQVASYGEVARAAGRPDAVRAVATAVGRNPVAALIPCHRVLRAGGGLGGYRWGTTRKRMLLAREAARSEL